MIHQLFPSSKTASRHPEKADNQQDHGKTACHLIFVKQLCKELQPFQCISGIGKLIHGLCSPVAPENMGHTCRIIQHSKSKGQDTGCTIG